MPYRTLEEIQTWDSRSLEEKNERALQILAAVPVPTPDESTNQTPIAPQAQNRRNRQTT